MRSPVRALFSAPQCGFILSAGIDRLVRYWDLAVPEKSSVVSGLDRNVHIYIACGLLFCC